MQKENYYLLIIILCLIILIVLIIFQIVVRLFKSSLYKPTLFKVNDKARIKNDLLEATFFYIDDAVILIDENGKILFVNNIAQELTGYLESEMIGSSIEMILTISENKSIKSKIIPVDDIIKEGALFDILPSYILISKDFSEYFIEGSIIPLRNKNEKLVGSIIVFKDITKQKNSEDKMFHIAYYDALTELPNRTYLIEKLNSAMMKAHVTKKSGALFMLDLDNFKTINDTMGHLIGDGLLKQIGECFASVLQINFSDRIIARIGGDEFGVLMEDIGNHENVVSIANTIMEIFQKPWSIGNYEYFISTSIGIAIFPDNGGSGQDLLKNADTALYKAKDLGKNNFMIYDNAMHINSIYRFETENDLRYALKRNEFILNYQPIVNLSTYEITGAEALIRWRHSTKGLISPSDFISYTETSGLIIPIGEWVLRTACRQAKQWIEKGLPSIVMSVNLSARQFQQKNITEIIENIILEEKLDPKYLDIEITETTAIEDIDFTIETLINIKKMGVGITLDDFGTGYSSLNYLKRLPIDNLKIDRSFVHDITDNFNQRAIAKALISLAHTLNLKVTAEGVETLEQLNILKDNECDRVQGYFFGKPIFSESFEKLLSENNFKNLY